MGKKKCNAEAQNEHTYEENPGKNLFLISFSRTRADLEEDSVKDFNT